MRAKIKQKNLGLTCGIMSAITWGTYGSFLILLTRYGLRDVTIIALAPTALMVYNGIRTLATMPKAFKVNWKIALLMFIHGAILTNVTNYCYVRAVTLMPVGIVSTIVFCNVLLLMVMTKIVFGSRYTVREIMAVVAAIIGVALILEVFKLGPGTLSVAGIWWAIPPMINYAIIFTFDKYYIVNGAKVEVILFYCNLFASVVLWLNTPPWKIAGDLLAAAAAHGYLFWAVVAGFVLVPIIISFAFFLKSYELIEPIFVSITQTFDPVTATFLGLLLFNQKLSIMQISGIAIVLAALGYFQYIDRKADKAPA